MYKLITYNRKGVITHFKSLGSWEDNAREEYARVRRGLERMPSHPVRLELVEVIDHKYETLLAHDQRWGAQ